MVMVYSLGPNRRRESPEWEVRGDDIAVSIDYRTSTSPMVPDRGSRFAGSRGRFASLQRSARQIGVPYGLTLTSSRYMTMT